VSGYGIFDLQLYTRKFEEEIHEDLICYLEDYPEITEEDEEVFPEFVIQEGLAFLYSGENFESVISGAFDQKNSSIPLIITGSMIPIWICDGPIGTNQATGLTGGLIPSL